MGNEQIALKSHYVKDLSFENPNYINFFGRRQKITIDKFNFKINSKLVDKNLFEIEMIITTQKKLSGKTLLVLDLNYAGLFEIKSQEKKYQLVDGPTLIYPYAKIFLSYIFKSGGFSEVNIPNINFLDLYKKNLV